MTWWQYLILANVYLLLFYGFYALLLRRETFFQLNRVYLVSSAILSFLIPLIQADWARNLFITRQINQTIYHLDTAQVFTIQPQQNSSFTIGQGLAMVYLAGMALLLIRFLLQLMALRQSLKSPDADGAFSFFKSIKLSDKLAGRVVIMAHEQVHAQQWHSADVMLVEAVMIINWFNPVVYFYRKAIKHIHEFIADSNVLDTGTSKKEYALLLLSQTFETPAHELVNPFFNHSLLKQRIIMLQKDRSKRVTLIKYGFSAPLFALMIILSSATVKTNRVITKLSDKATEVMMIQATANAVEDNSFDDTKQKPAPSAPVAKEFKPGQSKPDFYTSPEHSAQFPGGVKAFGKFLENNIRMTPEIKHAMPVPTVIVQFIVEKNGRLRDLTVLRGSGAAALEALRVLSLSPAWKPGMHNGKIVRQQYTVPIKFAMPGVAEVRVRDAKIGNSPLFTVVEHSAEFPGGFKSLGIYLAKSITITTEIRKALPLQRAITQFVVEEDGEVTGVKVVRSSGNAAADAQAIKALSNSPKWKAGTQNGRAVRQLYTVPINFSADAPQKVSAVKEQLIITDSLLRPASGGYPSNRVIRIVTIRRPDTSDHTGYLSQKNSIFKRGYNFPLVRDTVKLMGTTRIAGQDVLYYVNGKKLAVNSMAGINPNEIFSINVLAPGIGAVTADNPEGKKGIIQIITKHQRQ